jgi:hypothetical protein
MRMVPALNESTDVGDTGGPKKLPQLGQLVLAAGGARGEKVRALTSAAPRAVPVGERLACASVAAALHPGSG